MGAEYKLEFRNITKAFPGVLALNNVSFGIKKGTIHVIMGENGAGKSTLMKIVSGVFSQTSGKMLLDGKEVRFSSPRDAERHGIGMIYQELQYFPDLTVERYLMLGREPGRYGFINWKEVSNQAKKTLEEANLHYNPKTVMRSLSVSDIQLLEITKVLKTAGCDIIIMDEPTSALSEAEVDRLFKNIGLLKEQGVTILYISHKIDEIFKIADYITVLRDGQHINTAPADEYTQDSLIGMMVGRTISNVYPKEDVDIGETVLEVKNLTSYASRIYDISFHARKGEILGLAGLMGSGRTEVVRALFGLDPFDSGEIYMNGEKIKINGVSDAVKAGIAMATEDRRRYGLILCRDIKENIALSNLKMLSRLGFMKLAEEKEKTQEISKKLKVKAPNIFVKASTLSGGNQQKVVLSKWLLANPKVLILDEPTRGIDVGAKYEIYKLMVEMARSGICIIMISSELPELIGMCDRAYTLYNGRITGELSRDELTQSRIVQLATSAKQQ
ncbi:MAG: sugar ABC transporter ATP-binding protein [Acetivibrionales bacterium]|jgi:inositol transport system ATP-binding protein